MDKLELLKNQLDLVNRSIADKKNLLSKEEDASKQSEIVAEIDTLNKAAGKLEAQIEAEKEKQADEAEQTKGAMKDAQKKSGIAQAHAQTKEPKIEIVRPGMYKGYPLKAEMAGLRSVRDIKSDEVADAICRAMINIYDHTTKHPRKEISIKAAMQEDTASEGAEFITTEVRTELLSYAKDFSIALQDASIVPMKSKVMTVPKEYGSITLLFEPEEDAIQATNAGSSSVTLTAKKLAGYSTISNELIDDTFLAGGITSMLLPMFIEAAAQKIDSAVFCGTGDPMSGIFTGGVGYSEVFDTGSTSFSELLEVNTRNLLGAIPERYLTAAKWYVGQSNYYTYVLGLKDTTGKYLFQESTRGEGVNKRLWGYPVRHPSTVPANAEGAGFAVFGDLKGVLIGERMMDMSFKVDPYTAMNTWQTKFYFVIRFALALAMGNKLGRIVTGAAS
jgi:HK97 family phage major capsid protein